MADRKSTARSPEERVYCSIYDAVQAQRMGPGVKLKETELAQLFQVSRSSVRNALIRLEHKGLVTMEPNRVATIRQPSPQECKEIFQARRAVEGAVVEILALHPRAETIAQLRAHLVEQRNAFMNHDLSAGHRNALGFHRLMADLAGNPILAKFVDELLARMPLVIVGLGSSWRPDDSAEHAELVDAIEAGNADAARQLLCAHLDHLETAIARLKPHQETTLEQMLNL